MAGEACSPHAPRLVYHISYFFLSYDNVAQELNLRPRRKRRSLLAGRNRRDTEKSCLSCRAPPPRISPQFGKKSWGDHCITRPEVQLRHNAYVPLRNSKLGRLPKCLIMQATMLRYPRAWVLPLTPWIDQYPGSCEVETLPMF